MPSRFGYVGVGILLTSAIAVIMLIYIFFIKFQVSFKKYPNPSRLQLKEAHVNVLSQQSFNPVFEKTAIDVESLTFLYALDCLLHKPLAVLNEKELVSLLSSLGNFSLCQRFLYKNKTFGGLVMMDVNSGTKIIIFLAIGCYVGLKTWNNILDFRDGNRRVPIKTSAANIYSDLSLDFSDLKPTDKIVLYGHSQGGTNAILCALDLLQRGFCGNNLSIIASGSLPCLSPTLASYVSDQIQASFEVLNLTDNAINWMLPYFTRLRNVYVFYDNLPHLPKFSVHGHDLQVYAQNASHVVKLKNTNV